MENPGKRGEGFRKFFKFAKPLVDFKLGLQPLIGDLIHDPNESVRAAMSACFWPVSMNSEFLNLMLELRP